jgi:hypothetical protein
MTTNTGGSAFPHQSSDAIRAGMTLRDYFAAKAMQAVFTGAIMDGLTMNQDIECDKLAMVAYTMADAMLKAREQK